MGNLFLKKLQIKPGYIVKVVDAPENASAIFGEISQDISFSYANSTAFNVLIIFSTSKAQINVQIKENLKHIDLKTIFWIFYPKKASKTASDLDLMKSWKDLNIYNLTPCASAAVNDIWTGLRVKFISEVKPSGVANQDIKANGLGQYIDIVNKTVKLPPDLEAVLFANTEALNYFNELAYTYKKEYVIWVLTAKQSKTRQSRIEKAVNMLSNNIKSPSAK